MIPCVCRYPMPDGNGTFCSHRSVPLPAGPCSADCDAYSPRPSARTYLFQQDQRLPKGVTVP